MIYLYGYKTNICTLDISEQDKISLIWKVGTLLYLINFYAIYLMFKISYKMC